MQKLVIKEWETSPFCSQLRHGTLISLKTTGEKAVGDLFIKNKWIINYREKQDFYNGNIWLYPFLQMTKPSMNNNSPKDIKSFLIWSNGFPYNLCSFLDKDLILSVSLEDNLTTQMGEHSGFMYVSWMLIKFAEAFHVKTKETWLQMQCSTLALCPR